MKANFGVSESAVVTAGSDRARGKGATTFTYWDLFEDQTIGFTF